MSTNGACPIEVFVSYSHEDDGLRKKLGKHLSLLKRQNVINEWHDRLIDAGEQWADKIDERLDSAGVGNLAGARGAFERALRILEKFMPADHPNIAPADHPNIAKVRENLLIVVEQERSASGR